MSIFAYVGATGSGKTYSTVVNQIMPALKKGRVVVTNVPLNRDEIRKVCRTGEIVEFPIEEVQEFPERIDEYAVPGCVLVLDEIWRLWPAGQKVDRVPEPFKSLLAEHRHRVDRKGNAMQIVLVSQDLAQVGAFARQLVAQTIYHTKLTTIGMAGKFRADIYQGPIAGPTPPAGKRVREVFGRYRPEIFKLYKSHTMVQDDAELGAVNEKTIDTRGNYLKRPMFVVGAVFVLAMPAFAIPYLADIVTGQRSLAGGAEQSVAAPQTVTATESPPPSAAPRPTRTQQLKRAVEATPEYSLVGYVKAPAIQYALIQDNDKVARIPFTACEFVFLDEVQCNYRGWVVGGIGALEKLESD